MALGISQTSPIYPIFYLLRGDYRCLLLWAVEVLGSSTHEQAGVWRETEPHQIFLFLGVSFPQIRPKSETVLQRPGPTPVVPKLFPASTIPSTCTHVASLSKSETLTFDKGFWLISQLASFNPRP